MTKYEKHKLLNIVIQAELIKDVRNMERLIKLKL